MAVLWQFEFFGCGIAKRTGDCSSEDANECWEKERRKQSSTQQAKRGNFVTKVLPRGIYLNKRLCNTVNEMQMHFEILIMTNPYQRWRGRQMHICIGLFSEGNEGKDLIHCSLFSKWNHNLCAYMDGAVFFCDMCKYLRNNKSFLHCFVATHIFTIFVRFIKRKMFQKQRQALIDEDKWTWWLLTKQEFILCVIYLFLWKTKFVPSLCETGFNIFPSL